MVKTYGLVKQESAISSNYRLLESLQSVAPFSWTCWSSPKRYMGRSFVYSVARSCDEGQVDRKVRYSKNFHFRSSLCRLLLLCSHSLQLNLKDMISRLTKIWSRKLGECIERLIIASSISVCFSLFTLFASFGVRWSPLSQSWILLLYCRTVQQ